MAILDVIQLLGFGLACFHIGYVVGKNAKR